MVIVTKKNIIHDIEYLQKGSNLWRLLRMNDPWCVIFTEKEMIRDVDCKCLDDMMNNKCPNYVEKDLERGKWKEERKGKKIAIVNNMKSEWYGDDSMMNEVVKMMCLAYKT